MCDADRLMQVGAAGTQEGMPLPYVAGPRCKRIGRQARTQCLMDSVQVSSILQITCHSLQHPLILFVQTTRSRTLSLQMWRTQIPMRHPIPRRRSQRQQGLTWLTLTPEKMLARQMGSRPLLMYW